MFGSNFKNYIYITCICISFISHSALALTIVQESIEDRIRHSELIVHGTVMKVETITDQKRVYTISTFRVHEALKGTATHTLAIRQVGGTYKGLSQVVVGMPILREGEEWVLFLKSVQDPSKQKTYHMLVNPHSARQIIKNGQGEKVLKATRQITKPTTSPKTLKLVKVNTQPTLQLKAPIHKKTVSSTSTLADQKLKIHNKIKLVSPQSQTSLAQYLKELKTSIDRSLAPKSPTH